MDYMKIKLNLDDLDKIKSNLSLLDQATYELGELQAIYEFKKTQLLQLVLDHQKTQDSLREEIREKYQIKEEFSIDLENGEII